MRIQCEHLIVDCANMRHIECMCVAVCKGTVPNPVCVFVKDEPNVLFAWKHFDGQVGCW